MAGQVQYQQAPQGESLSLLAGGVAILAAAGGGILAYARYKSYITGGGTKYTTFLQWLFAGAPTSDTIAGGATPPPSSAGGSPPQAPGGAPTFTVNPSTVTLSSGVYNPTSITISGSGFTPSSPLTFTLNGQSATAAADANGNLPAVSIPFGVNKFAPGVGQYMIVVTDSSGHSASATLSITAAPYVPPAQGENGSAANPWIAMTTYQGPGYYANPGGSEQLIQSLTQFNTFIQTGYANPPSGTQANPYLPGSNGLFTWQGPGFYEIPASGPNVPASGMKPGQPYNVTVQAFITGVNTWLTIAQS